MIYTFSNVLVKPPHKLHLVNVEVHGGRMVSALASELSGPGSSPGRGHCVVFMGMTLCSRSAFLGTGV